MDFTFAKKTLNRAFLSILSVILLSLTTWNFSVEWRLKTLFTHPSMTTGVIGKKSAEGHGIHYFTYSVDGRGFKGKGQTDLADPRIGTPTNVYYLKEDPENSALVTRSKEAWIFAMMIQLFAIVLFLIATGPVIVAIFKKRTESRLNQKTKANKAVQTTET